MRAAPFREDTHALRSPRGMKIAHQATKQF
jgi:hypothetical protein